MRPMPELEVVKIPTDELLEYQNNVNLHSSTQVDQIASSIEEFGFSSPILAWHNDDGEAEIVAGHGRLMAARKLGITELPVVFLDHLSDEQRRAFGLVENQLTRLSEFDLGMLEVELGSIVNIDMSQFDFDVDIDDDVFDDGDGEVEEDEVPEDAHPIVQKGDVWQLGRHRLMCGDSTDAESLATLMDGTKAEMVFTDPPYGYSYQSNMRTKSDKFDVIENDDKILDFFPSLHGMVNGFVMVCTTWKVLDKWLPLFSQYFALSNMIIWDKGGGGIGDLRHTFSTDYEVILCANNGAEIRGKRIGSVWSIGKVNASDYEHPTQKPVGLAANAIRHTTDTGQSVLDLFGGSGSTLMACEQLNRTCYMMELDPHYCDIIIERWQNLTGQTAQKVE